jgi:hypothetical protein
MNEEKADDKTENFFFKLTKVTASIAITGSILYLSNVISGTMAFITFIPLILVISVPLLLWLIVILFVKK